MLLACIGLYGIMAYGVTRRTPEFGVRMALGAVRRDVVGMVLRETTMLATCGIAVGVPLALWLSRLARTFLFGLQGDDPVVLAVASSSLFIVCAVGGSLPAWRAAHIDPITILRNE
jgi:ABC-type antimicrobial peptide transport system permease subunit